MQTGRGESRTHNGQGAETRLALCWANGRAVCLAANIKSETQVQRDRECNACGLVLHALEKENLNDEGNCYRVPEAVVD